MSEDFIEKKKFKDANAAEAVLGELCTEDDNASKDRAIIQGAIDGNPPYSEKKLKDSGQGDRINVNWGQAASWIEDSVLPYFDMLTSVENYAQISVKLDTEDTDLIRRCEEIIAEEFTALLNSDLSFIDHQEMIHNWLIIHGYSFLYFRDQFDWRAFPVKPWNIKVPRDASASWHTWEYVFFIDNYYAHELYAFIENAEFAESVGWNVEGAKTSLKKACYSFNDRGDNTWEKIQQDIKNNGLTYSNLGSKKIIIANLYVREYNGKISHYIFDRNNANDWLYKNEKAYNNMSDVFAAFFIGIGNGDFHGIRGLGKKVCMANNAIDRLTNAVVEKTLLEQTVMLQAKTEQAVNTAESVVIGPFRILPPNLAVSTVDFTGNINNGLTVTETIRRQAEQQNRSYAPNVVGGTTKRVANKDEIASNMALSTKLTATRAQRYLKSLDVFYTAVYKRATDLNIKEEFSGGKEALEFQNNCIKRGVPELALKTAKVKATRPIGYGSEEFRQQIMAELNQFMSMLPEKQRNRLIRDNIAAIAGKNAVDSYAPELITKPTGADVSIASLENNAFLSGGQVMLDYGQSHFTHLVIHLQFAKSLVDALSQQAISAIKVDQTIQAMGPHIFEHLNVLKQDPTRKQQAEELTVQISELLKIADSIRGMAEEEQQAQQEQTQQAPDPKMAVVQNKIQLDNAKAENDMRLKEQKAQQQMRLKDTAAAVGIQLKQQKAQDGNNNRPVEQRPQ